MLHRLHFEREQAILGNALRGKVLSHHVKQGRFPATANARDHFHQVGVLERDKLVQVFLPNDHTAHLPVDSLRYGHDSQNLHLLQVLTIPSTKLANPTSFVDARERPRRSFASNDASTTEVKCNSLPLMRI